MNWVKEFDDQVKNMVDESNSKETAQYWKKRNILSIHSLCTRGVQNIRLTRQPVRPAHLVRVIKLGGLGWAG